MRRASGRFSACTSRPARRRRPGSPYLKQLSERGLTGVEHVSSVRDRGLQEAIRRQLPGVICAESFPTHATPAERAR